jgi:hypothetical protein
MKSDTHELDLIIMGMRADYTRGDNVMALARSNSTDAASADHVQSTLKTRITILAMSWFRFV